MQPTTPTTSTFTPDELTGIKQQYDAYRASQKPTKSAQPTAKKGPGGIRGVLNNLLPIAGGALGALAGVPLGPAGIAAGGALGSGIGEGFKEHNNGQGLSVKNIAEQSALGALPGVGSGVKALRAGEGAASLIGRGATTAGETAASTAVTKPNFATRLYNKGVVTEGRTGGFGQGEKLSGGDTQGFRDTEENVQNLANEGIPRSNATSRQIAVGDRLDQHSKTIDAAVDAKNPAVTDPQKADILGRVQDKITGGDNGKGIPGYIVGDNANSKFATSLANQFAGIKDAKGLHGFKKALDQQAINYGRNSAAPDPIKEQIAKAFRQEVNTDFKKMVPEAATASNSYSKLHDANEFLKQAARDQSNAATQPGGSLPGRVLTSDTAETVKAKAGGAMQTLGKALGAKTGKPGIAPGTTPAPAIGKTAALLQRLTSPVQVGKAAIKQGTYRGVAGLLSAPSADQQPAADTTAAGTTGAADTDLTSALGNQTPTAADSTSGTPDTTADSKYPVDAYMKDLQRDPKNSAQYTAVFNELNPNYGSAPSNGLNVTKVTGQQYGLAQSGSQSLQQLSDLIQKDPSIVTKTAIPGKSLPIIGGAITNASGTGSYDSIGYNIADTILRLRTGATANSDEVKKLQSQIMPRAGDSAETIQTKLDTINGIFGGVLNLAKNSGTQDATTTDLTAGQ